MKKLFALVALMVLAMTSSALALSSAPTVGANVIGVELSAGYLLLQDNGTIEGLAQLNYGAMEQLDIFALVGYAKPKHDGYIEYGAGAKYLILAESGDMPALAVKAFYKGFSLSVLGVNVSSYVIPIQLIVSKMFGDFDAYGLVGYNLPKEGSGTFGVAAGVEYPLGQTSSLVGQVGYDFGTSGGSGVFSVAGGYNMVF